MCFEIDEAGGGLATLGEGEVPASPAEDAPPETTPTDAPATDATPGATGEADAEADIPELDFTKLTDEQIVAYGKRCDRGSMAARLSQLVEQRNDERQMRLEAEAARQPQDEPAAPTTPPTPDQPNGLPPECKGLEYDASDNTVNYKGAWLPPEIAAELIQAATFRESLTTQQTETKAQEFWGGVASKMESAADAEMKALMPTLDAKLGTETRGRILSETADALLKLSGAGEQIDETVISAMVAKSTRFYAMLGGHIAAEQAAINKKAAETEPVPASGNAAMVGNKSFHEMDEAERSRMAGEIMDRTLAKVAGG